MPFCVISLHETIEQADGTLNYKRTYKACMESIQQAAKRVSEHRYSLQGLTGRDIHWRGRAIALRFSSKSKAQIALKKTARPTMGPRR